MSDNRYRNITAAIWLIGLGILALLDAWWPGILILIGLTMVVKALKPEGEEPGKTAAPAEDDFSYLEEPLTTEDGPHPAVPQPPLQVTIANALPSHCPMCGAPVDAKKVKHNPAGASLCSYCDAKLDA